MEKGLRPRQWALRLMGNGFYVYRYLCFCVSMFTGIYLTMVIKMSQSIPKVAMAPHSSTLAWKIPWTEDPGRLQSMGSLRVRHDWATSLSLLCIGEGNGNPLQCSCLENPRDGEPDGLPSMGLHRVGHDWSNLAAAERLKLQFLAELLAYHISKASSSFATQFSSHSCFFIHPSPHPHPQPVVKYLVIFQDLVCVTSSLVHFWLSQVGMACSSNVTTS